MKTISLIATLAALLATGHMQAQVLNQMTPDGNITQGGRPNFNPHNKDTATQKKEIPRGMHVWTIDRRFGDISRTEPDTMPHLFPHSTLATGMTGEYSTTGSNYTPRLTRIFANRRLETGFSFADVYSQIVRQPDNWHFTNTLSPITNLTYDNCGDKTNGEDHINARFAANFGKRLGVGFDLNYLYARGYFQNQNNSHFDATLYASYLGDQYQMHAIVSNLHQKAAENGGIANDDYLVHPEIYTESFADNEIPTVLANNWNRNDTRRLFLTHRYALGFYRKVKMTEEELKAREFAKAAAKDNETTDKEGSIPQGDNSRRAPDHPSGRPDGALIAGIEPPAATDSLADSTRIVVSSKQMADSLLAEKALQDSIEATMKREFVPVTSFIHTLDVVHHDRIYQAYESPTGLYAATYYDLNQRGYRGDSIYDQTRHLNVSNTLALALLEGFNKYAPAGIKAFATHQLRRYTMPQLDADGQALLENWTEHNVSIGGQLIKQQGQALHYNLTAETWLAGEDAGQLKLDATGDINFPLFGDTVRLAAKAYFYRLNPTFLQRQYHSKHFWWDNGSLSKETRSHIEGIFRFEKTHTQLRMAVDEIQNHTYLAMAYQRDGENRQQLTSQVRQHGSNISIMMAQLDQKLRLGPLHWDNTITWQQTSNDEVVPLPKLNIFTNLYLEFTVARVLRVELGGAATYFTKYKAPDYCPQLGQFAVQENADSRVELGNFPIVDIYANMHLKHARFFVMMTNAMAKSFNRMAFLAPHYPLNRSVLHVGISWNFFN